MFCFTTGQVSQRIRKGINLFILVVAMLAVGIPLSFATTKQSTTQKKQTHHNSKKKTQHITHHQKKKKKTHQTTKHKTIAKKNKQPIPNKQTAKVAGFTNLPPADSESRGFVASIEKRLVDFVHKTVNTLRYSAYKMGGSRFDTSRGIYIVDCSRYVDNILRTIYPNAYSNLVNSSGSERPTTHDYYDFFSNLSDQSAYHWNKVDAVEELQPGDILVFRYKNARGNETGGHVMIVMDKPIQDTDENAFLVRVADSAALGHSEDTRPRRASGIGIGTLLLKVDPKTYQPSAYAWRVGARWNENVNFAMARPIGKQPS